jgi:hypothetical protein
MKVLDLLEDKLGASIELRHDYFWTVPAGSLFVVDGEQPELVIGQVTESWNTLSDMLDDEDTAISYGAVWLGDVLRAIGEQEVA